MSMTTLSDAYSQGVASALTKFAATRGLKEIRRSVAAGDIGRANRLATTPGVLSPSNVGGSQIRHLGGGAEGLATLVAHPQHGISVRKTFDPNAPGYSPELIARMGSRGNVPGMAAHYGAAPTLHGTPMHFNEYVQGREATRNMSPEQAQSYMRSLRSVKKNLRGQGYAAADLRPGNAMITPTGETKFIDAALLKPEEVATRQQLSQFRRSVGPNSPMRHAIVRTEEGVAKYPGAPARGFSPDVSSARPGQFTRYMFTGDVAPVRAQPLSGTGTELLPASTFSPSSKTQTANTALMKHAPSPAPVNPPSRPFARQTGLSEFL